MALADFKNAIVTEDKFSGTFRKFDAAVGGSAKGVDKLGGLLSGGGLGAVMGGAAGVAGLAVLGKTVWSLGELGAQSLTTKASFESLMRSVGQSPALLDRMTAAAGGTITEMQLMQQANTALAGTSGQLAQEIAAAIPQLIEAGRAAAMLNPSMGDAAFMTQSLITGIKRGSPMLIDNTGITLKLGEATEAYAASVGKSVSELTAQETSIAILRATLAGSNTLIQQVGGSLDSMTGDIVGSKVASAELKTVFAELFAPPVAAAARTMADILRDIKGIVTSTRETRSGAMLAGYREELERLNSMRVDRGAFLGGDKDVLQSEEERIQLIAEAEAAIARLTSELLKDKAAMMAAAAAADIFNNQGAILASTEHQISDKARAAGASMAAMIGTAYTGIGTFQTLTGTLNGLLTSLGGLGQGSFTGYLGFTDVLSQKEYLAINEKRITLESQLQYQVDKKIISQDAMNYQLKEYDNTVTNHLSTLRNQGTAISSVGTAYDSLKDKISAALRPTFDLSGLTGGALGGMGGDSFDEAYKRLAAVALRPEELQIHQGDWAGTFEQAGLTGLSPEDAQARAKELVEAYAKGLDFSLIDTEKIKDSARQAIKAEELYQAMVDEIYAEMGKENPKAKSAGEALGKQINAGVLAAAKGGGAAYNNALAEAVSPYVARILAQQAARYEQ